MMKLISPTKLPPLLTAGSHWFRLAKYLPLVLVSIAVLGFADASYLTVEHFLGDGVRCFLVDGCDVVTTSPYSLILGQVPVASLGIIFYLVTFFLSVLIFQLQSRKLWQYLFIWSWLGVIASIYFLYIQAFVLQAYCIYCLFSAGFSLVILLGSWFGFKLVKN